MKSVKCQHCGLVSFADSTSCKRCSTNLEGSSLNKFASNKLTDEKTVKAIQAKQYVIYSVGGFIGLFLGFGSIAVIEDGLIMALLFVGFPSMGLLVSWFIASLVESKTLNGNKMNYKIPSSQKLAVFLASLFFAYTVFINSDLGYFLAPLMIIFFNGALYLYEFQMKKRVNI